MVKKYLSPEEKQKIITSLHDFLRKVNEQPLTEKRRQELLTEVENEILNDPAYKAAVMEIAIDQLRGKQLMGE